MVVINAVCSLTEITMSWDFLHRYRILKMRRCSNECAEVHKKLLKCSNAAFRSFYIQYSAERSKKIVMSI